MVEFTCGKKRRLEKLKSQKNSFLSVPKNDFCVSDLEMFPSLLPSYQWLPAPTCANKNTKKLMKVRRDWLQGKYWIPHQLCLIRDSDFSTIHEKYLLYFNFAWEQKVSIFSLISFQEKNMNFWKSFSDMFVKLLGS